VSGKRGRGALDRPDPLPPHRTGGLASLQAVTTRVALIERLTRTLAQALTTDHVVSAVAGSLIPAFRADGLIILAVEEGRLHPVGSSGYSPGFLDEVSGAPYPEDSPVGEALRTGVPQFFESTEDLLARFPRVRDYPLAKEKNSRIYLPLVASGRAIGVGVLSYTGAHRLGGEERTLLTALGSLIAQALERARLHDATACRARELQRALLPHLLPSVPAVTAAAHYLPSGLGAEVGGDWYDLIPLSAERVALVIGDVMGHGIAEAATMGRLRTAVRTLSDLDLPPDDILDRVNDIVGDLGEDDFATCLYGVYDSVTGDFAFASAGHPPPLAAFPDGTVTYLASSTDPPLGIAAPPFETVTANLPDGGLLVLYTDGFVQAGDGDAENGMARLALAVTGAVGNARTPPVERLRDTLAAALIPSHATTRDDAALLIVRANRLAPSDVASWPLPEDPRAAGQAREHVRGQLAAWHLGEDVVMTTELLVSELVSNVVRHARGPIRLRLLRSRSLTCEVSDGSLTTPHIRRTDPTDEGGRGLQLVSALSQRWGARYTSHGKSIWTEQRLP
jgi:serine phosphatase RsbU (regulator of sigma subunit)/anti-sigma regulatory factor (Ser/Thr protein kinase)